MNFDEMRKAAGIETKSKPSTNAELEERIRKLESRLAIFERVGDGLWKSQWEFNESLVSRGYTDTPYMPPIPERAEII